MTKIDPKWLNLDMTKLLIIADDEGENVLSIRDDVVSNVITHEDTYNHLLIGTSLQSETSHADVLVDSDIGVTVQAAGTYLTSETSHADVLVDSDIGVTVQAYDSTILTDSDIGVTVQAAGTYLTSETSHADVLVDSDIGVTVQAYDSTILTDSDIGVTVQAAGTYLTSETSHADVLVDSDIGVTVQAYDSNLTSFATTFTLPEVDSTAGYVIKTDGAGTLSFTEMTGGSDTAYAIIAHQNFYGTVQATNTSPEITGYGGQQLAIGLMTADALSGTITVGADGSYEVTLDVIVNTNDVSEVYIWPDVNSSGNPGTGWVSVWGGNSDHPSGSTKMVLDLLNGNYIRVRSMGVDLDTNPLTFQHVYLTVRKLV